MSKAKKGDKVKVHYTGRLNDQTVFDTSDGRAPLEFTIGEGRLIKGFENGLIGMEVGETKTLTIPPQEAYGERREELTAKVEKKDLPENIDPSVGMQLQVKQPDGSLFNVLITEVEEQTITLDANHPLAGQTLNFEIELAEIV